MWKITSFFLTRKILNLIISYKQEMRKFLFADKPQMKKNSLRTHQDYFISFKNFHNYIFFPHKNIILYYGTY